MNARRLPRIRTSVATVLLAVVSAGCTAVRPWERDHLAGYGMRPDRDPLAMGLADHLWFSREGVHGGRSIGGGGCGCN